MPTKVTRIAAPIRQQAADLLRDAIQSGEISPGTPLIERELCARLDVSRNTLREAYRELESEGLIEVRPHRSPITTVLTDDQARELYEVREALEGEGIMLFTQRADNEDIDQLEEAGKAVAAAVEHGTPRELLEAKDKFYEVIFRGAHNTALDRLARITFSRLAPLRVRSLSAPGRPSESAREVLAVIGSVRARNGEAAQTLWRQHVRNAGAAAMRMPPPGHPDGSKDR